MIKQTYPSCFVLAVGGITTETAKLAMEAGADGVAVISAILKAKDVRKAVEELRAVIS
jgi:thiamine-phosphate pyrophosphorylase